jgi:hypothetical protein
VFAVYNAIPTIVDASLALPVLDSTMVRVRFQNLEKFLLDLFLRSKLEAFHPTDDVPIQLIGSQRLTVNEVRVRGPWEASCHPRVIHNFG